MHTFAKGILMLVQKRKRRDYRLARRAQFSRPEPGFSLYEGRTRGKRIRYTYSDEEGAGSDGVSTRQSNRQSGVSTPAEPTGPTYTASGRQVRSRHGGAYGETMLSGRHEQAETGGASGIDAADDEDDEPITRGRNRGAAPVNGIKSKERRKVTDNFGSSEQSDDESDVTSSGHEWDGGDDDADDQVEEEDDDDEDLEMSDEGPSEEDELADPNSSLVVRLRLPKGQSSSPQTGPQPITKIKEFSSNTNHDMTKFEDTEMADAPSATQHQVTAPNGILPVPQRAEQLSLLPPSQSGPSAMGQSSPMHPQDMSADPTSSAANAPRIFNPHAYTYTGEPPAPNSGDPPPLGYPASKQGMPSATLPNGTA